VGIEARRHQNELRPKLGDNRQCDSRVREVVVGISCTSRERQVDREARPRACTDVPGGAGTRVVRILVRRDEEHRGIVVKAPLRAVAVMHVEVDDRHARQATRASVRGRDGDVVEEAEAHRARAFGVVSWWTDDRTRASTGPGVEHVLDRGHRRAGGQASRLPGSR